MTWDEWKWVLWSLWMFMGGFGTHAILVRAGLW